LVTPCWGFFSRRGFAVVDLVPDAPRSCS